MITTIVPLLNVAIIVFNVAIIVFNVAIIVHHTVIINLSFASGASLCAKHLIHSTDHLDNVDHDEEEEVELIVFTPASFRQIQLSHCHRHHT